MPQRETQIQSKLDQWRGVNQRLQPTLVPDGFFMWSQGVYFGLGDNAQRITGKVLTGLFPTAILATMQFGDNVLVQTLNAVYFCPVSDLSNPPLIFTAFVVADQDGVSRLTADQDPSSFIIPD